MKSFFILLTVVFTCTLAVAQPADTTPAVASLAAGTAAAPPIVLADRPAPAFPLGQSLAAFIATELTYPEIATDYAIEGTVVLEVEVSSTGKVTYLRTVRPLFAPLDEAAVAAVGRMPRLLPAVEAGRPVARRMMIPLKFTLR